MQYVGPALRDPANYRRALEECQASLPEDVMYIADPCKGKPHAVGNPIMEYFIFNSSLKNEIKNEIDSKLKIYQLIDGNNFNDDSQPVFSDRTLMSNFILENKLNCLKDEIFKALNLYNKNYNLSLFRSWVCFTPFGKYGEPHTHLEGKIAGVYYYDASGKSNLILHTTNGKVFVKPKDGMIVLFPGWMTHEIEINNSRDMRISIAFQLR